ncbi:MAG TPA: serine/threonine-protein kinase [Candidatus Competibacteraceae bacterium]|nr:serine/threonine-protein kinase [Candidatus Competibacteraceae bacterium]HRZ06563.1 serine/threonine-protein kinase [Candidatus Competibacteraceae bacterium]HSA46859.1 serine/threonine-protein kinase [Candidatus Competibacteraceae bacterium]
MLPAGSMLGAYRLETLLGRGAMGAVYRGVRVDDGALAAIKTIHADLLAGRERDAMLARFRQEAQIGMQLHHPLIVRVYDCGEQDGLLYLTMDLVEGQELGRLLNQRPALPLVMNLAIVLQVLNALAYAHQHGVIHRDIKPANIMVRQDYTIALTDFGIAHLSGSQLTQVGELLGSPLYMAPEQLWGEPVDSRTDLFSTGVLLYFLLTHHKPFMADSLAALMQKILHEEPLPPSSVNRTLPAVFDVVLQQALAKDPAQRFASAAEFAHALRQARTEALNATVIASSPRRRRPVIPLNQTGANQATVVVPTVEARIESMTALVRECLTERATVSRLDRLAEQLAAALMLVGRAPAGDNETADRRRLRQWCVNLPLTALAEQIERDAPLPGRILQEARGDWLELVRLFALLRNAGRQIGNIPELDAARDRIIERLTDAFLNYSSVLNPLLFSVDGPQLTRLSADLMRLDLLQLALEELEADAEVRHVRQTLLLFANQVMSRINALIRQFLEGHDPLVRFDVANLLVEVDELITLAERLLAGSSVIVATGQPSGAAMAEFIENARTLGRVLADELIRQIQQEQRHTVGIEQPSFSSGQTVFVGRLRQLGLFYRFVAYWQTSDGRMESLCLMATEMHCQLEDITNALLAALQTTADAESSVAADLLWARLTIIADLAEQFGWPALHQRVLLTARSWVQMT